MPSATELVAALEAIPVTTTGIISSAGVMPGGERYFMVLKSATSLIGRLNQPSGSGPIGCTMWATILSFRTSV